MKRILTHIILSASLGLAAQAQTSTPPPVPYLSPAAWWAVTNGMAPGDLAGLANLTTQGGALSTAGLAAVQAGLTADDVSAIAAMAAQVLAAQAQVTGPLQPTQMSGSITVANHVLNVNLGGQTNDEVGLAAIGHTNTDFWTGAYFPYQQHSAISNLLWSDKTTSGISLLISNAPGDWANGAIDPMLRTYAYSTGYGSDITLMLAGVPAGSYALYLYGHGPTTDDSIFSVTSPSNGLGTLSTGPNWQSSTWSNGAQYVVFSGLNVSSGQAVTVNVQTNLLDYALVSGLQLLPYSNAVPDLLHDTVTSRVPFMGVPFVVTGIIEAEQFDLGGTNTGYYVTNTVNATTNYRVCNLCISTNTGEVCGGFCVDKLRPGEWLTYSLDVRVAQTYAIEPRVAGIGSSGTFSISFSTNWPNSYYSSNVFTVPTTSWTNVLAKNVFLQYGTNIMTIRMLTDGNNGGFDSGAVAKLNYVSIYPSWTEGLPAGLTYTNSVAPGSLSTNMDWASASSNSVVIQNAIDSLSNHGGGTVQLPAGAFYLASRLTPNEGDPAEYNSALYVYTNNVQILGSNTVLVAHDRDVTTLCLGYQLLAGTPEHAPFTNFVLSGLTLQGSPHWAYDANNSTNQRTWELGWLSPPYIPPLTNAYGLGDLVRGGIVGGPDLTNLLITNCVFKNPACGCAFLVHVTDVLWRSNSFIFPMDLTNGTNGAIFTGLANPTRANTATNPAANQTIWVGPAVNFNILECSFSGDTNQTNNTVGRTPDGLVWIQGGGGNWFVGRTAVTSYGLEAITWNSGPGAIAQDAFSTVVNTPSTCGFNDDEDTGWSGVTDSRQDLSFAFVGNVVTGGRQGIEGQYAIPSELTNVACLVVSGNTVSLLRDAPNDTFGASALVTVTEADRLDVAGNTLTDADVPIRVIGGFTNAIILQNNFAGATLCGIDDESQGGQVASSLVLKNTISWGTGGNVSGVTRPPFHLRAPRADGPHWFLIQNTYVDTNGLPVTPVFLGEEPSGTNSLPLQFQP